jgi:hypothetical protein
MQSDKEHVSLWHPWQDKPGTRHTLTLWNKNGSIGDILLESIEELIELVARQKLYVFCNDVMDEQEFTCSSALLQHPKSEAYISRTGKVIALKLRNKRQSGFLIPANVWGYSGNEPNEELLKNVKSVFKRFNFEALTPASLSEKVLRSTLPEHTYISRPSDALRRVLLAHSIGGRIDRKEIGAFYPCVYSYDMNKAYLYFSGLVPSPFKSPVRFYHGQPGNKQSNTGQRYTDFSTAFMHVALIAHGRGLHPLHVRDEGISRNPGENEVVDRWMWDFELQDCIEKGYTLQWIYGGYGWYERSSFMSEWSDILYREYTTCDNPDVANIIKTMMVGVPGRFLQSPEVYTLIHESERKKGDIPIILRWTDAKILTTPWLIRSEYHMDKAQLTPVGHYIVARCRQEIYHRQQEEVRRGNTLIRSYIDSYSVEQPTTIPEILGTERGKYKEKIDQDAWVEENRIIPYDITRMKAPSYSGEDERMKLWNMIHNQERKTKE